MLIEIITSCRQEVMDGMRRTRLPFMTKWFNYDARYLIFKNIFYDLKVTMIYEKKITENEIKE